MRLLAPITASLCLLGKLVEAGTHSRGPEALYFYYAYRLDVEVSSAEFPDEERPWKLAPSRHANLPEDWPDGQVDESRKGMNVHAFMSDIAKNVYGRGEGQSRVADPWFPALDEFTGLARWPRDDGRPLGPEEGKNTNRYSWEGIAPGRMLGDLNDAKGQKPGSYFNFDNILAIVANRAKDLYEKNPEIGAIYYDEMRNCVREAQVARRMDGGDHKKNVSWKLVEQWLAAQPDKFKFEKKRIVKTMFKEKTITILAGESSLFAGERHKDMDWFATKQAIIKTVGKNAAGGEFYAQHLFPLFRRMAQDMEKVKSDTLELIAKSKLKGNAKTKATLAVKDLDVAHRRAIEQLSTLDQAMGAQGAKADGSPAGCGFPPIAPPDARKLRRTLKARRRMSKAKRRGVNGQGRSLSGKRA